MKQVAFYDDAANLTQPHHRTARADFFISGELLKIRGVSVKAAGGVVVADAWLEEGDDDAACSATLVDMVVLRYGWSRA